MKIQGEVDERRKNSHKEQTKEWEDLRPMQTKRKNLVQHKKSGRLGIE